MGKKIKKVILVVEHEDGDTDIRVCDIEQQTVFLNYLTKEIIEICGIEKYFINNPSLTHKFSSQCPSIEVFKKLITEGITDDIDCYMEAVELMLEDDIVYIDVIKGTVYILEEVIEGVM